MWFLNKAFKCQFKSFMAFKWLLKGFSASSNALIAMVSEL
jgi:hypothetical protein